MKAIDRDFGFLIKTVVSAIFNCSSIEQGLALYSEIEPLLGDFVRSPHGYGNLFLRGELNRFLEGKVMAGRDRALIQLRKKPGAQALKNTQMGIAHKIGRQPADVIGFKLPALVGSRSKAGRHFGCLVLGKDANDRDKRVGIFRVVPFILISKRDDEIAVVVQWTLAKVRRDFGFDPVYNLTVKRQIIVWKIDIPLD